MKPTSFCLTLGYCTSLLLTGNISKADLFHEGFESGSLSGWVVTTEFDESASPFGSHYGVGANFNGWNWDVLTATNYPFDPITNPHIADDMRVVHGAGAPEGEHFLTLNPASSRLTLEFTNPNGETMYFFDRNYRVVMSREFSIAAGQTLSLWANYWTEELPSFDYDDLEVRINGANIFRLSVGDVGPFDPATGSATSGWTNVTWLATESGTFTLSLVASQDDQLWSYGSFDDITIIPEPSPAIFLSVGMAMLTCRMRIKAGRGDLS